MKEGGRAVLAVASRFSVRATRCFVLVILFGLILPCTSGAQAVIRVKGSRTLGRLAGPALMSGYWRRTPHVTVQWESLGSSSAFLGLLDGSADLGVSSRSVNDRELEWAKLLGVTLKEYVVCFDGIGVLVHPTNSVDRFTIPELARIFSGQMTSWVGVGGRSQPIQVVSLARYAGTSDGFKARIFPDGERELAPSTMVFETAEEVLDEVARNPGAISFLSAGWVRSSVKVVPIAFDTDRPATLPHSGSLRTGAYPLAYPIRLYTCGEPSGELRRFLTFLLAGEGQEYLRANGFIALDVSSPVRRVAGEGEDVPRQLEVFRIFFRNRGGAYLDAAARLELASVLERLQLEPSRALIVGHADLREAGTPRSSDVSWARARAVAEYLERQGVSETDLELDSREADLPLAANATTAGRRQNRRVDIWLLPHSS